MTILAIILALTTAALARTAYRLLRQRDAERRRGDLALAELDAQIEETNAERDRSNKLAARIWDDAIRIAELEAEALPILPPWSGPPSLRVVADVEPLIFRSLDGAS